MTGSAAKPRSEPTPLILSIACPVPRYGVEIHPCVILSAAKNLSLTEPIDSPLLSCPIPAGTGNEDNDRSPWY